MRIEDKAAINLFYSNPDSYRIRVEKDKKTGTEHLHAVKVGRIGKFLYKLGFTSSALPKVEQYLLKTYGNGFKIKEMDRDGCMEGCTKLAEKIERYHTNRKEDPVFDDKISPVCVALKYATKKQLPSNVSNAFMQVQAKLQVGDQDDIDEAIQDWAKLVVKENTTKNSLNGYLSSLDVYAKQIGLHPGIVQKLRIEIAKIQP